MVGFFVACYFVQLYTAYWIQISLVWGAAQPQIGAAVDVDQLSFLAAWFPRRTRMSDSTNAVLQRAYELIEDDELEQAQELLAPLLETEEDNPSLWWVYSHALRDQSIGQLALDRVLELDPSYPGANELKNDVLEIHSSDPEFLQVDVDESVSAQDAMGSAIDDWDDIQPELEDAGESSGGRLGAVVLAIILFVVAAWYRVGCFRRN